MAKTIRQAAKEAMQRFGYDPIEVLVRHAQDQSTNRDTQIEIAQVLLPYMYPKLSTISVEAEVTTNQGHTQAELFHKILSNPELADAAQRLSVAAAELTLGSDLDIGSAAVN